MGLRTLGPGGCCKDRSPSQPGVRADAVTSPGTHADGGTSGGWREGRAASLSVPSGASGL